ncbi:hypothetical protein PG993_002962 [Apiospora rasikravindrae]|uniref:Hemerythrin-like domain-containing protein n=1 Tax=Apiospora rasikravindrae TaxID=990691 RepID=A0ABR1TYK3_9PEZI
MSQTLSWQNGPWPLISFVEHGGKVLVREMITIHNALIRGLTSIYLQCVNVETSPEDTPDFVAFCKTWGESLREHHETQETDIFPFFEEATGIPGLMKSTVEKHRAFDAGLAEFMTYIWKVEAGEEKYSGPKVKASIEVFAPALHQHLVNEIPALLALDNYSDKVDWEGYWKIKAAEILEKKSSDPTAKAIMLPFVLSCTDATFEDGVYQWPPNFPWAAKMITRYYYFPQHGNWWRFGPADSAGQPRELPFVRAG